MTYPKGFNEVYVSYDWLVHYYRVLRENNYQLYPCFDDFVGHYLDPHSLIIQGPGIIIRVQGVDSKHMGKIHGFVLSRDVFKGIDGIRELTHLVMDEYFLLRLESEIPEGHRGVGRLLEKVGFNKEGYLRYRGKRGTLTYDTVMYSIIRGD